MLNFKAAGVNLARFEVPEDATCTVQRGIEMTVRDGFVVLGDLVLVGRLIVEGDS